MSGQDDGRSSSSTGVLGVLDSLKKIRKSVQVKWLRRILKKCQAEIEQEVEARAAGVHLNSAPGPAAGPARAPAVASPGRAAGAQAGAAGPATRVQPAAKKRDSAAARMDEPERGGSNKRARVQEGVGLDASRGRAAAKPAEKARATGSAQSLRSPQVQRRGSSAGDFAAAELAAPSPRTKKSSAKDLDKRHVWTAEERKTLLHMCDQAASAEKPPRFDRFAKKRGIRLDKVERRAKMLLQARMDAGVAGQSGVSGKPGMLEKKNQSKDGRSAAGS